MTIHSNIVTQSDKLEKRLKLVSRYLPEKCTSNMNSPLRNIYICRHYNVVFTTWRMESAVNSPFFAFNSFATLSSIAYRQTLTVTFGVGFLGLSGPKAPIVLGTNTRSLYCLASSMTLCTPSILTLWCLK